MLGKLKSKLNFQNLGKSQKRGVLIMAAFAVIGVGTLLQSFAAEDVVSYDSTKPVIPQLQRINAKIKTRSEGYQTEHPTKELKRKKDKSRDQLVKDFQTRRKAMKVALMSHPEEANKLTVPDDVKAKLPDEALKELEKPVEVTGRLVIGHYDPIDEANGKDVPTSRIYTPDGQAYGVYNSDIPPIDSGSEVKLTGLQVDSSISVTTGNFKLRSKVSKTKEVKGASTEVPQASGQGAVEGAQATFDYEYCSPNMAKYNWWFNNIPCGATDDRKSLDETRVVPSTDANGGKRLLIVPIAFKGDPTIPINPVTKKAFTPADLKNLVAGSGDTVKADFSKMSYGKLQLEADVLSKWVSLDVDNNLSDCSASGAVWGGKLDEVQHAARSSVYSLLQAQGTDIDRYSNVLYVINNYRCPKDKPQDAAGQSSVGNIQYDPTQPYSWRVESEIYLSVSVVGSNNAFLKYAIKHELGHAMGVLHAHAGGEEYGDPFDTMGSGEKVAGHFNAFYKKELGWLDKTNFQDVTASGTYNISMLEKTTGGTTKALRIPVGYDVFNRPTKALYVEYRPDNADTIDNFKPPSPSPQNVMQKPGVTVREVSIPNPYVGVNFVSTNLLMTSKSIRLSSSEILGAPPTNTYMDINTFLNSNPGFPDVTLYKSAALNTNEAYRYSRNGFNYADGSDVCLSVVSQTTTVAKISVSKGCTSVQPLSPPPVGNLPPATIDSTVAPVFDSNFGSYGSGPGQFNAANGVATDSEQNIYVSDPVNNTIQKFSKTGAFIKQWGTQGSGDGQFASPADIAIDGENNVYVADSYNYRVQKFTKDGVFIRKWGTKGTGDGLLGLTSGIAVDTTLRVYVADQGNRKVQVFDKDGKYAGRIGASVIGNGGFGYSVFDVAVSLNGRIYVSEGTNAGTNPRVRITIFNSDFSFYNFFGSAGTGNGQFYRPSGIAIDGSGDVYIVDSSLSSETSSRVQKFDYEGRFILSFGTGKLLGPSFITIDKVGQILVTDTSIGKSLSRVVKFKQSDATLPAPSGPLLVSQPWPKTPDRR